MCKKSDSDKGEEEEKDIRDKSYGFRNMIGVDADTLGKVGFFFHQYYSNWNYIGILIPPTFFD